MCMRHFMIFMLYTALCVLVGVALYALVSGYADNMQRITAGRKFTTVLERDHMIFSRDSTRKHFYEPKPDSTKSVTVDWLSYTPIYTLNNDGLNERFDYPYEKPPGTFRILTLGDSFTFGEYVNTADNFSERLEDLLNSQSCAKSTHFEVINLGVSGYDISYMVERFRKRGVPYRPDLVIWLMNGHNFYQMRDKMKDREIEIEQRMSTAKRDYYEQRGIYYYAADRAAREVIRRYGKDVILETQKAFLGEFSGLYDGPVLFAFFSQGTDGAVQSMLRNYAATRSAPTHIFNGIPDLIEIHGSLPDMHPSTYGHKIIAGNLFAYILANNMYQCR